MSFPSQVTAESYCILFTTNKPYLNVCSGFNLQTLVNSTGKKCFHQKIKALNSSGTFTMASNNHCRILAHYNSVLDLFCKYLWRFGRVQDFAFKVIDIFEL